MLFFENKGLLSVAAIIMIQAGAYAANTDSVAVVPASNAISVIAGSRGGTAVNAAFSYPLSPKMQWVMKQYNAQGQQVTVDQGNLSLSSTPISSGASLDGSANVTYADQLGNRVMVQLELGGNNSQQEPTYLSWLASANTLVNQGRITGLGDMGTAAKGFPLDELERLSRRIDSDAILGVAASAPNNSVQLDTVNKVMNIIADLGQGTTLYCYVTYGGLPTSAMLCKTKQSGWLANQIYGRIVAIQPGTMLSGGGASGWINDSSGNFALFGIMSYTKNSDGSPASAVLYGNANNIANSFPVTF